MYKILKRFNVLTKMTHVVILPLSHIVPITVLPLYRAQALLLLFYTYSVKWTTYQNLEGLCLVDFDNDKDFEHDKDLTFSPRLPNYAEPISALCDYCVLLFSVWKYPEPEGIWGWKTFI